MKVHINEDETFLVHIDTQRYKTRKYIIHVATA